MRKATIMLLLIFVCLAALRPAAEAGERRLYTSGDDVLHWLGQEPAGPTQGIIDELLRDGAAIEAAAGARALPAIPQSGKTGWQKAVTIAFYPFTPYRTDTEDRVMNILTGAYVSVGYWDLFETLNALNASPTIRETSPVFGDFFNGRPHPANAFLVHTAVNYAFLSGIRFAHNWAHDRNSQTQGKWKRASEYALWGLVVGLTVDRGRVANNNRKLAAKYGK